MISYVRGETATWAASGRATIKLNALPSGKKGSLKPYFCGMELIANIASTVGAGGQAVTPIQWKNLLASLTMMAGGPWGPVNLNGEQLEAHHFYQTAKAIPFAGDTAGDTNAANSAGAITRRVKLRYYFDDLASPDSPFDFCPPCEAIRNGELQLTFSAAPTNTSANTISYTPVFKIVWRNEDVSVPRVRTVAKALVGKNQAITESGALLRLLVHNISADMADADFTGFRVYKDGDLFHEVPSLLDQRDDDYTSVGKVTSSLIQETLCDPLGGNFVRTANVYPQGPRFRLGDLPVGDNWRYDYDGAPTVANYEVIYTIAYEQDEDHVVKMLSGCGCDVSGLRKTQQGTKTVDGTHVLVHKGPEGSVLGSTRLKGFVPITMVPRGSPLAQVASALGASGVGGIGR